MWPFTFWFLLLSRICGSVFVLERNRMKSLILQSWAIPRFSFQYTLLWEREAINHLTEKAILEADQRGANVMSLGLLNQVFEPFGPVELVQLPLDLETGQCKGFGFVQFAQLEHAKAAQSLNGKLEIAGRIIKVSAVTDHAGANVADFDDDDGGGLLGNLNPKTN